MTDRELMQEALYALTYVGDAKEIYSDTIESLRARLAQPEQEPVAWMVITMGEVTSMQPHMIAAEMLDGTHQLYTAPPQRDEAPAKAVEWQGLTDEEIREFEIWLDDEEEKHGWNPPADIVKYIEAKLKDKNHAV